MAIELRLPDIKGSDREQLKQIRSYLYQLIPELQFAFNSFPATDTVSSVTAPETPSSLLPVQTRSLHSDDTGWISLGLLDTVAEPSRNIGQRGDGCYYRVVGGNHIYIAFSCAFQSGRSAVTVNGKEIPAPYKPPRNIYALNPTDGSGIATVFVNSDGNVGIDHVQNISSGENTDSYTVNWIDGYIDYWI
jgi:hypothetical protein